MSVEFWDSRYAEEGYAYGTEPSALLKVVLPSVPPGRILFPAEGEGRNAVYAASLGWTATAFDQSPQARVKALALAAARSVSLEYHIAALDSFDPSLTDFDAVALMFVHLPPAIRTHFHRSMVQRLKPGGIVLIEAFTKEQLNFTSGGPKDETQLFSPEILADDFAGLTIIRNEAMIVHLNEGPYHTGDASVVRFVGKK